MDDDDDDNDDGEVIVYHWEVVCRQKQTKKIRELTIYKRCANLFLEGDYVE